MFKHYEKKTPANLKKQLADLTRILQASFLLSDIKRRDLVEQIESNALDPERFDRLGLTLLNNVATHCQSLPEPSAAYYAYSGGMLDHLLNRTEASLSLFKIFLLDEKEELSEEQKLWQYALFSASLLQGIGKLVTDFTIQLYDIQGVFLKQWNPLLESAMTPGSHYDAEIIKDADLAFRTRITSLFARSLMPLGGFAWIASDAEVLKVWLALLNEDFQGAGTLGALLVRANAISIQRYLNQLLLKMSTIKGGRFGHGNTFIPAALNEVPPSEQAGLEFLQWLINSLESGAIILNKPPLLTVPGGLVMSVDAFKLFVREHPGYKNWQAVYFSFLGLGLASPQHVAKGTPSEMILNQYAAILPSSVHVYCPDTKKNKQLSSLEAIQFIAQGDMKKLQVLNQAGKWQTPSESTLEHTHQPRPMAGL